MEHAAHSSIHACKLSTWGAIQALLLAIERVGGIGDDPYFFNG